jgi:hypothetical protein
MEESDCMQAWYWMEWILTYDSVRNSKACLDPPLVAAKRPWATSDASKQGDVVWIVWEACIKEGDIRASENPFISHAVRACHDLFSIGYKRSYIKKRRCLLYAAIAFLTEPITNNPVVRDKKHMAEVLPEMMDKVYIQLKENEVKEVNHGIWR